MKPSAEWSSGFLSSTSARHWGPYGFWRMRCKVSPGNLGGSGVSFAVSLCYQPVNPILSIFYPGYPGQICYKSIWNPYESPWLFESHAKAQFFRGFSPHLALGYRKKRSRRVSGFRVIVMTYTWLNGRKKCESNSWWNSGMIFTSFHISQLQNPFHCTHIFPQSFPVTWGVISLAKHLAAMEWVGGHGGLGRMGMTLTYGGQLPANPMLGKFGKVTS